MQKKIPQPEAVNLDRRHFLKISGAAAAVGFISGSVLTGTIMSSLPKGSTLERFLGEMRERGWDTSHIQRNVLIGLSSNKIDSSYRHIIYNQAFLPNKSKYVKGWGKKKFGSPGMFSVE